MKHPACTLLLLVVTSLLAVPAMSQTWEDIPIPELPPFEIAEPQRHELDNGLVIFLMEDHELPLIDLTARIRGGARLVPAEKTGLADIFGETWRTGGTESRTGDELDDMLEARAAKVESSMGTNSATLRLNCLKEDFPEVLEVFTDLLHNPAFREDKIEIAKQQVNTGIARRNDDAFSIVQREVQRLGYGKESPYARIPEYDTVSAVTRDDLLAWHAAHVHPNQTLIGVAGDFDSKEMLKKLQAALGSWPRGPEAPTPELSYTTDAEPGYYLIDKQDVTQAQIGMVHLGIRRDDPDYYAVQVMNEILSGGFPSRMFTNIRSNKGLAYAVWAWVVAGYDHPGLFWVGMGTDNATVSAGIDALFEELEGIAGGKPPTAEELKRAKDSILNSFIFNVDSKREILGQQLTYAFFGYPPDSLQQYRDGVEKVTLDDVIRVSKEHIHPDQLRILVVGNAAEFDQPLSERGPVTELDISIPEPSGPEKAEASDEAKEAGRALFSKVAEGLGGADKLAGLQSATYRGSLTMKTPMGEMKGSLASFALGQDRFRQELDMAGQSMVMVVTPETAFMVMGGAAQDIPGSQREEMEKEVRRNPIFMAQNLDDPELLFVDAGTESVDGRELRLLDVTNHGVETRLFVDPETGRIVRSSYRGMGMAGPAQMVTDYSDYREVDGIWVAFREEVSRDGTTFQVVELTEFLVNPELSEDLFVRPQE